MEYDLYQDESRESGFWHGILLVPRNTRLKLLNALNRARQLTGYKDPLTLKGLRRKEKRFECIRLWIEIGVNSLIQNPKCGFPLYHRKKVYSKVENRHSMDFIRIDPIGLIRAKFIVFREAGGLDPSDFQKYSDFGAKVETIFRISLKGGLHFLFHQDEQAHISSMHFHGYEHLRRAPDRDRIIGRLRTGLKEFCSIPENILIDSRTGDHRKMNSQDYNDCQFLQLTDLLIGSFRTHLCEMKNKVQGEVSLSVESIIERWNSGFARMKNSRWYKGFCITDSKLDDVGWCFENQIPIAEDNDQIGLFKNHEEF